MSRFLKLTQLIINTNHIHSILIKPNKYHLQFMSNKLDGSNWRIDGSGLGAISSYNTEIEVCKNEHQTDYKILSDWIDKL